MADSLGARVTAFLDAHGLSQSRMASDLKVSDATVSDIVNDNKRPGHVLRRKIAVWSRGQLPSDMWDTDEERAALVKAARVRPYQSEPPRKASKRTG